MTTGEIISKVDRLEPNQYDTETKLQWLSQLDGKIISQVILTHEPFGGRPHRLHWRDPFSRDPNGAMPDLERHCIPRPLPDEEDDETEKKTWGPPYHDADDELMVKDPYGEDIYVHYLQAKIAEENAEIVKYNQQKTLFDASYQEWTDYYNRTHMPANNRGGNRLRW